MAHNQVWYGASAHQLANMTTFSNTSLAAWPTALVHKIERDTFVAKAAWLASVDFSTPLAWAHSSNAWTCNYLFAQIFNGTDPATSGYASGAYPVVELQVARAPARQMARRSR